MAQLQQLVRTLQNYISNGDKRTPAVSNGDVKWHIDHSLRVIINITSTLKSSSPSEYKWRFNSKRALILLVKKIPRGQGRAPLSVTPTENLSEEELNKKCEDAIRRINELETLPAKSHFAHPYFGDVSLRGAKKFLAIHTIHHIKIIEEILE
jgi:hypothetical protein